MPENTTLYRIGLSTAGFVIIGFFGLLAGLVWALAVGANIVLTGLVIAAIAGVWGATCVQLTPTGGVIMENKTTVNYAVIALHGWMTFLAVLVALIVWAIRVIVF
jgi:hypothetical protein